MDIDSNGDRRIKTTASALSWDEWAGVNDIKVVNVPVGFKEIANIMKKVELQIRKNPEREVIVEDVFGEEINLGIQPRLIFGGEESFLLQQERDITLRQYCLENGIKLIEIPYNERSNISKILNQQIKSKKHESGRNEEGVH